MSTITAGNVTVSCSLSADTTGNLVFQSGGNVTAMTIDTSQNVGIGTSSPATKLEVASPASTSAVFRLASNKTGSGAGDRCRFDAYSADNSGVAYQLGYIDFDRADGTGTSSYMAINTRVSGTVAERARIDSSGNLLVGTTTKYGKVTSENGTTFDPGTSGNIVNTAFTARGSYGGGVSVIDGTQGYTMWAQNSGADFYIRRATTSSAHTGGVYISNAAGSWSAASDERLKNIIRPIENAVENLSGLRCVIGEYKDNVGAHHPFLIAQDVQAVFPEVVNQMDEQGHLGMSYTDMVPILVKAIQEQQQMIEELKAEVAALKGVKA